MRNVTWFRIEPRSGLGRHMIVIATTPRGYVYAFTTADMQVTIDAKRVWREERRDFRPYDESNGAYLA